MGFLFSSRWPCFELVVGPLFSSKLVGETWESGKQILKKRFGTRPVEMNTSSVCDSEDHGGNNRNTLTHFSCCGCRRKALISRWFPKCDNKFSWNETGYRMALDCWCCKQQKWHLLTSTLAWMRCVLACTTTVEVRKQITTSWCQILRDKCAFLPALVRICVCGLAAGGSVPVIFNRQAGFLLRVFFFFFKWVFGACVRVCTRRREHVRAVLWSSVVTTWLSCCKGLCVRK